MDNMRQVSEGSINPTELLRNLKKGFWAVYRYYLTSLGRFRSEGIHTFNANYFFLATSQIASGCGQ